MGRKGLIALVIGLALFAGVLWQLDFFENWKILLKMNPAWLALSMSLMALHQFLSYAKWSVMYKATGNPEKQPLMPVYASVLVSGMLTPARSGDVLASLSWRGIQGKVLACSIFNRISEGVMTLVISLCVFAFFFQSYLENLKWFLVAGVFFAIAFLMFGVFNRTFGLRVFHAIRVFLQKFSHRPLIARILAFEKQAEVQVEFFYDTMTQFRRKHVLPVLIGFTFVNRVVTIWVNMTLLFALGVFLPWPQVLGILAATWVSVFLTPIPGGFGIGDVAPSLILDNLGYRVQAGSFLVINHTLDIVIIFFWAVIWNRTLSKKFPKTMTEEPALGKS